MDKYLIKTFFIVLFLALSGYMPLKADYSNSGITTFKPIPMRSTSGMPLATSGREIGDGGWEKPGGWADPVDDGEGGGSGGDYEKPGTWADPYEGANSDLPVGDGLLPLLLCLAVYAGVKRSKRKGGMAETTEKV